MDSKRHITAIVILPLLFAYIYLSKDEPFYFLALLMVVNILAMREFYIMYKLPQMLYIPAILIGGILFYISCRHPAYFIDALFISFFFLLLIRLLGIRTPSGSMSDIGPLGVGFFYICGFMSFQWFLRDDVSGIENIFLLYASVWMADSAAYYVGTYMGKNKLYPAISPNKTLEGLFGSILGGSIGALIIKVVFNIHDISIMTILLIGAVLGIAAVLGDLIESMFKRDAGVKDSSNLIPGHGGLLDKIDGLLIAGPILYIILRYI